MLDNSDTATLDAAAGDDVVRSMHEVIEHQQAELKFKQTKIEALNFEIARMTHWRLCSSSMVTRRESSWDTLSACNASIAADAARCQVSASRAVRRLMGSSRGFWLSPPAANSALAMVRFIVDRLLAVQPKSGWVSVALPSD